MGFVLEPISARRGRLGTKLCRGRVFKKNDLPGPGLTGILKFRRGRGRGRD